MESVEFLLSSSGYIEGVKQWIFEVGCASCEFDVLHKLLLGSLVLKQDLTLIIISNQGHFHILDELRILFKLLKESLEFIQ